MREAKAAGMVASRGMHEENQHTVGIVDSNDHSKPATLSEIGITAAMR